MAEHAPTGPTGPTGPTLERLVGVYDADGTAIGELRYWFGARLGRAHCALCDLTHGMFRERSDWQSCRAELPAPFETYHRDDQPERVRAAAAGALPVVVAETSRGARVLLGPEQLDELDGSVDRFVAALLEAIEREGIRVA